MSAWPGKYVIGLTGNIATGKSEVRKMLARLGAFGIDADQLAHQAIEPGAAGFRPVLQTFGETLLTAEGAIDRAALGKIVFSDPQALARLEAIIHPIVRQAIHAQVMSAAAKVIVIEAIKLIEGGLYLLCDSVWVTTAPVEQQAARLLQQRQMAEKDARQRILAQAAPELKMKHAQVVISNHASLDDTWQQVMQNWRETLPPEMQ
jgi:dephospho-CoA kinase